MNSGCSETNAIRLLQEKIDYLQKNLPDSYQKYLLWRGCSPMPCGIVRPHVITYGTDLYVGGGNSGRMEFTRVVMKYDTVSNKWSSLPITACYTFSMALVKGMVTIIGGCNVVTACISNVLNSYDNLSGKWCVKFPPMLTNRSASSAVSTSSHVVVVGGISDDDGAYIDEVEVLDTSSMFWNRVCPFPMCVTFMSITACSLTGRIYLLGGLSPDGSMNSVFSCTISELVATGKKTGSEWKESNVWKIITNSPYCRSGGAVINGKLVVASGLEDSGDISNGMHYFDPQNKNWTVIGEMPSGKTSCSIAVLPGGQVIIVGGYTKPKNWIGSLTKDVMATVNLNIPL